MQSFAISRKEAQPRSPDVPLHLSFRRIGAKWKETKRVVGYPGGRPVTLVGTWRCVLWASNERNTTNNPCHFWLMLLAV